MKTNDTERLSALIFAACSAILAATFPITASGASAPEQIAPPHSFKHHVVAGDKNAAPRSNAPSGRVTRQPKNELDRIYRTLEKSFVWYDHESPGPVQQGLLRREIEPDRSHDPLTGNPEANPIFGFIW
jgi:hypothetical protein